MSPLPDLVLYARPGCHLCDEAREAIELVLAERRAADLATPTLTERNIEDDPDLHRRYLERIPVVELGDQRVELFVSVGKLRRLLREAFDREGTAAESSGAEAKGAETGGAREATSRP